MKIGIITFWESNNNYGQILQVLALQTVLLKEGHTPFLIRYHRVKQKKKLRLLKVFKIRGYINFVKRKFKFSKKNRFLSKEDKREFENFKNKYIIYGENDYYSLEELKKNPPQADVYITGSDQIWNNNFAVSAEAFLLGFGDRNIKKLSYAASFGVNHQDQQTQILFKKHLNSFSGISVREKKGLDITKQLGFDATWVLDPTMLLDKKEWYELLANEAVSTSENCKNKQIFIYTLGNSIIKDKDKFIEYSYKQKNYKIVHTSANNDFSGKDFPTIPEWFNHINKSQLVITTSFHCIVFCIITKTNFIVLPNTGKAIGMNDRIESLLNKLGLIDHLLPTFNKELFDKILHKKPDWKLIHREIANWREESYAFFKKHL